MGSPGRTDARTVDDRIRSLINDGLRTAELSVGSKIPTERALSEDMGVPRTAVRSALAALEREGLVTREVGRGTFVAARATVPSSDLAGVPQTSPAEIMATRLLLEPEVAGLAARHATQADIDHLHHCLRRGNAGTTFEDFEAWDAALHRGVATAAHNALLLRLFDTMNAARDLPIWGSIKRRSATPERRAEYEIGHQGIVDALEERHPELARDRMRDHLLDVRNNLLGHP